MQDIPRPRYSACGTVELIPRDEPLKETCRALLRQLSMNLSCRLSLHRHHAGGRRHLEQCDIGPSASPEFAAEMLGAVETVQMTFRRTNYRFKRRFRFS